MAQPRHVPRHGSGEDPLDHARGDGCGRDGRECPAAASHAEPAAQGRNHQDWRADPGTERVTNALCTPEAALSPLAGTGVPGGPPRPRDRVEGRQGGSVVTVQGPRHLLWDQNRNAFQPRSPLLVSVSKKHRVTGCGAAKGAPHEVDQRRHADVSPPCRPEAEPQGRAGLAPRGLSPGRMDGHHPPVHTGVPQGVPVSPSLLTRTPVLWDQGHLSDPMPPSPLLTHTPTVAP